LAYLVEVAKPFISEDPDSIAPPSFYFFRYVVDADTGDVIEDARAPVTTGSE